jgi:hypothetical protein
LHGSRLLFAAALTALAVPPPVAVEPDSLGRLHISLAAGRAGYEAKTFDCAGNVTDTDPVALSSAGARVDYDVSDLVTITAYGGAVSTPDRTFGDGSVYPDEEIKYYDGIYGGLLIARDEAHTGFGLGFMHLDGHNKLNAASAFVRIGNRDGLYFRGEAMPPEPAFATTGWLRLGVGHGLGRQRQLGWYAGAAWQPYSYDELFSPRLFADFRVPVVDGFDLLLGGQVGDGEDRPVWSFSSGLRWTP